MFSTLMPDEQKMSTITGKISSREATGNESVRIPPFASTLPTQKVVALCKGNRRYLAGKSLAAGYTAIRTQFVDRMFTDCRDAVLRIALQEIKREALATE